MDTLYVLCRSVDHRHPLPLEAAAIDDAFAQKKAYFSAEAETNPLVREILGDHGRIRYDGIAADDRRGFLEGRATFFRTHEILRKTRKQNTPICVGSREYTRDEVTEMFTRCVPNVKLHYLPWCSLERYQISLALAWGATLLTAHAVARGAENDDLMDPVVLYYMGIGTTLAALIYTSLKQNRDVRHAAPWNSAMYLDLNADLLRRSSLAVAVARKEFVPQEKPFKSARFYYALARKIEAHGFDDELLLRTLPAHERRKSAEAR